MTNINPTDIDEIEEKKWLISRIDAYHELAREELGNDLKKCETEGDRAISKLRGRRNNILSVLGVILTVVLGINSTYPMGQILFFIILTSLGLIGLMVLILFNWLIRIIEDVFLSISEISTEHIGMLAKSHGFITTNVARLSNISLEYANNYFIFTVLLATSITIDSSKSLKKLAKRYSKFPDIRSMLNEGAKINEKEYEFVHLFMEKLQPSLIILPELLEFVNKTTKDYMPKK